MDISGRLRSILPVRGWLVLAALFASSCWANIVVRAQWGLDSRFYLAWTYVYLGHSRANSTRLTHNALRYADGLKTCYAVCWPPNATARFFGPDYGATVGPRALYPVLSAPFVWLFGPNGMLVLPVLAFLGAVVALVAFVSRLYGPRWALVAGAGLILPTTISRWAVTVMTESPALLVTTAILLVLPLSRATGRKQLWAYLVLLELGLFIRQYCEVIPVAVALTWLLVAVRDRRVRNPWLPFAVWGAVAGAITLWIQGQVATLVFGGPFSIVQSFEDAVHGTLGMRVRYALPEILRQLAHYDYDYVRATDMLLLVILGLTLVAVLVRFRSELSALAVGMFVATYAVNVLVVSPTQFRYASPQYAYFLVAALALLADLTSRRNPTTSTEAAPGSPWHRPATPPARTSPAQAGRLMVGGLWLYAVWNVGTRGNWSARHVLPEIVCLLAMTAAVLLLALLAYRLLGPGWALLVAATVPLCPVITTYAVHAGIGAVVLLLSTLAMFTLPITLASRPAPRKAVPGRTRPVTPGGLAPAGGAQRSASSLAEAKSAPTTLTARSAASAPITLTARSASSASTALGARSAAMAARRAEPRSLARRLDELPERAWARLDRLLAARWRRWWLFGALVVVLVAITPAGLSLVGGVIAAWLVASLRRDGGRRRGSVRRDTVAAAGGSVRGAREPLPWRNRWLPYAMVAAVGAAVVTVVRTAGDIAGRLGWPVPGVLARVEVHRHGWCTDNGPAACAADGVNRLVTRDFHKLVDDRVLYALLVLAAVAVVVCIRYGVVAVAAGAFATGAVVQLVDGTLGFGDYLPAFPAVVLAVALLLRRVTDGWPSVATPRTGSRRLDVRWIHFRRPARVTAGERAGLEPVGSDRVLAD